MAGISTKGGTVMKRLTGWLFAFCAMALAIQPHAVQAQETYPNQAIRFVVPFPPGGGADTLARIAGEAAGKQLGQQFIIENQPGAGGNLAAIVVKDAAPDGYTLLQGNVAHTIGMSLYDDPGYEIQQDFVPIIRLGSSAFILAVGPNVQVKTLQEFVELARSKPGELTYGSSGNGGPSHLAMEMLKSTAGIDVRHIPYKGAAPVLTDLLGGRIDAAFLTLPAAIPQIEAGAIKGLAVTSAQRSMLAANFPTVAESGYPGYEAVTWFGLMAPKGTPAEIIGKLHKVFQGVISDPVIRQGLLDRGFDVVDNTAEEFAAFVSSETKKWAVTAEQSHAKAD
ncbi:tripartite-type tricarboxylate transporter receptor subunit TctC [Shinella sp. BE166]|uniref:Bug family tripartite tricarboxylate transporter substrate binding protein n=1 Tax=Shinella sp. BE166 TaxID=3373918 RepID=UPI003EBB0AD3